MAKPQHLRVLWLFLLALMKIKTKKLRRVLTAGQQRSSISTIINLLTNQKVAFNFSL